MQISLNTKVEVTLTERGVQALAEYYDWFSYPQERREKVRVGSKMELMLWEVANIFGPCMDTPSFSAPINPEMRVLSTPYDD